MKIMYILNGAFMGGATISFLNMIEGLAKYGVQPVVIFPRNDQNYKELTEYLQMHHISFYAAMLAPTSLHKPTNILHFLRICLSAIMMPVRRIISFIELKKIAMKERPDIIHTNVGIIREGLQVARSMSIPHILHIREYQDKDFGWLFVPSKKGYEDFVRKSDAVITITDDLKRYFNLQGLPYVRTIYNGIYSKDNLILSKHKQNYFCCACRLVPGKGYEDVLEAFSQFHQSHPDYELRIAGQGEKAYIAKLKSIIAENPCKDHIKLLGHIRDVRPLMAEAKALLVASKSEGFGRMTAEACFNGCLVIGRNTGGTKEILSATGGFLFQDIPSMVECMKTVCLLSEDDYMLMATSAQQKAIKLYSMENNAELIYQQYEQLMKNRQ